MPAQLLLPYFPKKWSTTLNGFLAITEDLLAKLVEAPVGPQLGWNRLPLVGVLKGSALGTHVPVRSYPTPALGF